MQNNFVFGKTMELYLDLCHQSALQPPRQVVHHFYLHITTYSSRDATCTPFANVATKIIRLFRTTEFSVFTFIAIEFSEK